VFPSITVVVFAVKIPSTFWVIADIEGVKAEKYGSARDIFGLYQLYTVVALLPENVLAMYVNVFVSPLFIGFGPVVNALKVKPNEVPPDKTVRVCSNCLTCLLFEKSNFVLKAIFICFIINILCFQYIYMKR
jgi:hypothetical protein